MLLSLLNRSFSYRVNGVEHSFSILPENISSIVSTIVDIVIAILLIYAIVLYVKMKKESLNNTTQNITTSNAVEDHNSNSNINNNMNNHPNIQIQKILTQMDMLFHKIQHIILKLFQIRIT